MKSINVKKLAILVIFAFFSLILYKAYIVHFASFGCFDECFNYVGGYFVLKGRALYSEIFFNHQMLMAYMSSLIQALLKPNSIYYLVLQHRMFVFVFGLAMDLLIMWRFGLAGALFAFLFEATKFYLMGSLFLAESVLVYPLVYIFGLAWQKLIGNKLSLFDYVFSGLVVWFIIFLREPMFLVALFLLVLVNLDKRLSKVNFFSLGTFSILTLVTLLTTSLPDYIYQVITLNSKTGFASEVSAYGNGFFGILNIFFYPFVILFNGQRTFFREILVGIDIIFFLSLAVLFFKSKKKSIVFILILILGLANLRVVSPGLMFYGAFHMLPWYGLFIMATFLLLQYIYTIKKLHMFSKLLLLGAVVLILYSAFSPKAFLHENIDRNKDFELNFDRYYIYGQAITYLAKPQDTLFLDGWDDLIYWQAGRDSSYKYVIYKGIDGSFIAERMRMFRENPPDFYYSVHENGMHPFGFLPEFIASDYVELAHTGIPSGLYINKSKLPEITKEQWEKISVLKFSLPEKL